mgnify:FL=1
MEMGQTGGSFVFRVSKTLAEGAKYPIDTPGRGAIGAAGRRVKKFCVEIVNACIRMYYRQAAEFGDTCVSGQNSR